MNAGSRRCFLHNLHARSIMVEWRMDLMGVCSWLNLVRKQFMQNGTDGSIIHLWRMIWNGVQEVNCFLFGRANVLITVFICRRKLIAVKPVGCINLRGVTCEETILGSGIKGFTLRPKVISLPTWIIITDNCKYIQITACLMAITVSVMVFLMNCLKMNNLIAFEQN
jgi:hypothetical protein